MKHILLVDDNPTNLKMAASVLQPYYQLSMAKSGKQALNFLKKNHPDLILLDLLMPEMDGYETMEEIKLNPRTSDIPIIFLTADKERTSEIKGLSLGALDFITKPFDEAAMLGRIEKILLMEDMRHKLFDASDKDPSNGLYTFDYVKNTISNHIMAGKCASFLLINIDNYPEARELAGSKNFSIYMDFFYESISSIDNSNLVSCEIKDNLYFMAVTDALDIKELDELCQGLRNKLAKEIDGFSGEKISVKISIGCSLCTGAGDFDIHYNRADKALYHVINSADLGYHIYRQLS